MNTGTKHDLTMLYLHYAVNGDKISYDQLSGQFN